MNGWTVDWPQLIGVFVAVAWSWSLGYRAGKSHHA